MRNTRWNEVTPEEQVELWGWGGSHKVNVVFKHPKYSFSKTVSRVEFFFFLERRLIVFVWTDENGGFPKRSFHTCHTAKGKGCYSISFAISFRVAGQKRLAYATCVRVFFRKRRKNSPLSNIFGYVWTWTRRNFHSVVYRDSLLSLTLSGLFSEAPTHRAPYS